MIPLLGTAPSPSQAGGDQGNDGLTDTGSIRVLGLAPGESLDSRGSAQGEPIADRRDALMRAIGVNFAGAWDLPVEGRTVPVVAVVRDLRVAGLQAAKVLGRNDVRVIQVDNPYSDLVRLYDLGIRSVSGLSVQSAVSLVEPANYVQVKVADFDSLTRSDREILVDLQRQGLHVSQTLEKVGEVYGSPGMTGVRIFPRRGTSTTYSQCTSGFAVAIGTGTYNLTASHCLSQTPYGGEVHKSLGDAGTGSNIAGLYGAAGIRGGVGNPDVGVYTSSDPQGRVYLSASSYRRVSGAGDATWLEQNMCWRGSTSATEKCAGVGSVDYFSDPGGYSYNRFCITGQDALPGDSGSGAYHKQSDGSARAAGIITLGGAGEGVACGVQISDATAAMLNASIIQE